MNTIYETTELSNDEILQIPVNKAVFSPYQYSPNSSYLSERVIIASSTISMPVKYQIYSPKSISNDANKIPFSKDK